jgi:hypothetical protein
VLQAPDNARGVARPLGGAPRDFAARNHPPIVTTVRAIFGGC